MRDWEARCKIVEQENEELRNRVDLLEQSLGITFSAPVFLELTSSEGRVFGLLLSRELVTKTMVMDALYGHRPDSEDVEIKIVDVFICKIRAKLKPWDIPIETVWGRGYYMKPATKDKVRALMEAPLDSPQS